MNNKINKKEKHKINFKTIGENTVTLLKSVNDAVILMNGISFIDCNDKALELFGCSTTDELLNAKPYELSPEFQPDGQDSKEKAMKYVKVALSGIPQFFEWEHTKINGEIFDTEVSLNLITVNGYNYLIAVVRDITRKKKAEKINSVLFNISKATGESESLKQLLSVVQSEINRLMDAKNFYVALTLDRKKGLYSIPFGIDENPGEIDPADKIVNLKNGFTDYVIRTESPLLANKYKMDKLFKNESIDLIGYDSESWLGVPLKSPREGIIGVLAIQSYSDPDAYSEKDLDVLLTISNTIASSIVQKRAEQSLKESEKRFKKLSDAADEGLLFFDSKEIIVDVNRALLEMTGYSFNELKGEKISMLFHDASHTVLRKINSSHSNTPIEIVLLTKNKNIIFCMSTVKNFDLESGSVKVATFKDISSLKAYEKEKKILQEKLSCSEKMEALGRLAGGVAHDLNNVLTSIISYPDLILMNITDKKKVKEYISRLKNSGQKAAAIVEDLLTLARRGVTSFKIENLNDIIWDYINSSEYEKIRNDYPGIEFDVNLEKNLYNINGSKIHLTATIMNLVLNSAEAISDKGKISITSLNIDSRGKKNTHSVCIKIEDSGIGMTKEEKNKIFEPFYTKKIKGHKGTGLGMSVVWGTIQDHKGFINVESKKGEGTTVELFFPATMKKIQKTEETIPTSEFIGNRERILVIDDESEPREIASEYLTKLNYKVDSVSSGEEAIKQFKRNKYDLIILDMLLGAGIDGLDTFSLLSKNYPEIKAIIVSGFSETERVKEAQRLGAGEYIKKPYSFKELGIAVKKGLELG